MKETPISPDRLREWSQASAFVFTGRIEAMGSTNLDGAKAEPRMATVQVEEVAVAPAELGDLHGRVITVYLETPDDLAKGDQVTFFARSWQVGRNIGVVEIGRTSVPASSVAPDIVGAQLQQLDDQLIERIRGAEAIISGIVTATQPVPRTADLPGFEEGVQWWVADMWIGSVEKGSPPEDQRIWFPEGGENIWGLVPKAHPRQEGVWLLRPLGEPLDDDEHPADDPEDHPQPHPEPHPDDKHPNTQRRPRRKDPDDGERRLMARQRLDFHASSDLPRIRTLLQRAGQP
ncbi:MAG: hypothetical protein ABI894_03710 [Ilumatobacteraceae bacterium]